MRSRAVPGTLNLFLRFGSSSRHTDTSDDARRNLVQLIAPPPHQTHWPSPAPSHRRLRGQRRRLGGSLRERRAIAGLRRARGDVARTGRPGDLGRPAPGPGRPASEGAPGSVAPLGRLAPGRRRRRVRSGHQSRRGEFPERRAACRRPAKSTSATLAALSPAAAPAASAGAGDLALGAQSDAVKALQQALIASGVFLPGGADGVFGAATQTGVKHFQRWNGLEVTGIANAATMAKLGAAAAAPRWPHPRRRPPPLRTRRWV